MPLAGPAALWTVMVTAIGDSAGWDGRTGWARSDWEVGGRRNSSIRNLRPPLYSA